MKQYPKFDERIKQQISSERKAYNAARRGFVAEYNAFNNTATVVLEQPDSEQIGEIIKNVPCPTYMGIQTVAPEPGRPCLVEFKGGRAQSAIITTFFNHSFGQFEYTRHNQADTFLPKFITQI